MRSIRKADTPRGTEGPPLALGPRGYSEQKRLIGDPPVCSRVESGKEQRIWSVMETVS